MAGRGFFEDEDIKDAGRGKGRGWMEKCQKYLHIGWEVWYTQFKIKSGTFSKCKYHSSLDIDQCLCIRIWNWQVMVRKTTSQIIKGVYPEKTTWTVAAVTLMLQLLIQDPGFFYFMYFCHSQLGQDYIFLMWIFNRPAYLTVSFPPSNDLFSVEGINRKLAVSVCEGKV